MTGTFAAATDLEDDEANLLSALLDKVEARTMRNLALENYYDGEDRIRDLGIAIPPSLRDLKTVVGWPGTAVDAVEERLDIDGWTIPGSTTTDVDDLWVSNRLHTGAGASHTDTLIYGLTFLAASHGGDDEPEGLITPESPLSMTGVWNARQRRLSSAASFVWDANRRLTDASLFLPDQTLILKNDLEMGWQVIEVDEHKLGRVPVVVMANRPRSRRALGASRITKAVRYLTDDAVRTLLGMEVAREFYSSPQRYVLGASEKDFVDTSGNPKSGWEVYLGRFLALDKDEHGNNPEIGQLTAGSPAPYIDSLKGLASLFAAEACLPASYLGFHTDNPPSGDGMRMLEARLVKVAERCQTVFGAAWTEAVSIAIELRDGKPPPPGLTPVWRDASTPTRAASADAGVKLVQVGILPPDSEVTYQYVGLSETQRAQVRSDARRARVASIARSLNAPAPPAG